jgi:hypothetical protein
MFAGGVALLVAQDVMMSSNKKKGRSFFMSSEFHRP